MHTGMLIWTYEDNFPSARREEQDLARAASFDASQADDNSDKSLEKITAYSTLAQEE